MHLQYSSISGGTPVAQKRTACSLCDARTCTHTHAGRSLREASGALAALPDRLSASQRTQMDTMLAAMRQDLKRVADQITNEEHAGLAAVNSRLAVSHTYTHTHTHTCMHAYIHA